jgi:hypothetical protein
MSCPNLIFERVHPHTQSPDFSWFPDLHVPNWKWVVAVPARLVWVLCFFCPISKRELKKPHKLCSFTISRLPKLLRRLFLYSDLLSKLSTKGTCVLVCGTPSKAGVGGGQCASYSGINFGRSLCVCVCYWGLNLGPCFGCSTTWAMLLVLFAYHSPPIYVCLIAGMTDVYHLSQLLLVEMGFSC